MEKLTSESKGVRNDPIQAIDRINEILEGLKAQTGAIAAITNPEHNPGNLCYISDFFWGMCNQLIDVMELVNKLPLKV